MTQRETIIEDMQDIETALCALEGRCADLCLTEKQVVRGIALAVFHLQGWVVKRIDDERRNKNE